MSCSDHAILDTYDLLCNPQHMFGLDPTMPCDKTDFLFIFFSFGRFAFTSEVTSFTKLGGMTKSRQVMEKHPYLIACLCIRLLVMFPFQSRISLFSRIHCKWMKGVRLDGECLDQSGCDEMWFIRMQKESFCIQGVISVEVKKQKLLRRKALFSNVVGKWYLGCKAFTISQQDRKWTPN